MIIRVLNFKFAFLRDAFLMCYQVQIDINDSPEPIALEFLKNTHIKREI